MEENRQAEEKRGGSMNVRIGFIGCGNMAGAMIGGILKKKLVASGNMMASAKTRETVERAAEQFGISVTQNNI